MAQGGRAILAVSGTGTRKSGSTGIELLSIVDILPSNFLSPCRGRRWGGLDVIRTSRHITRHEI
jgi:hypothetical protein